MNLKEALVFRQEKYTRTEKALFMVAPKFSDGHADFQNIISLGIDGSGFKSTCSFY